MKKHFFIFIVALFICVAQAQAEMITPFSYTKSFDGNNKLLYKTFNKLFDLQGSDALTGNQQLYETYAIQNPGTIAANEARLYGLTGTYSEKSIFSAMGDSGNDILNTYNAFPSGNDITQFYNGSSLLGENGYTGDLSFRIENSNGIFYSDAESYDNYNKLGKDKTTDVDVNHFLYFDITSMMKDIYGSLLDFEFTSAYLVGYEDRSYYVNGNLNTNWDGDYNDGLFLVFTNDGPSVTPEPASILIFGVGLVGLGLGRRRIRKNK